MTPEQRYCRGPLAKMFNGLPKTKWISNPNITFSRGTSQATYESGRPDGFVRSHGRAIDVECKAAFGSVFLGNPTNPTCTRGWHYSQRNWWQHNSVGTDTPYLIALWTYPEPSPQRVLNEKAYLFLVPPQEWIQAEQKFGRRIPVLNKRTKSAVTVLDLFRQHALIWCGGTGWHLPERHPASRLFL